jgi:four helix bundle protein
VLVPEHVGAQAEELKQRTRRFALDVIAVLKHLPDDEPASTIRRQLVKAAMSIDLNYRASCRARSHAEFTAKLGLVAEEADESASWLDLIVEARLTRSDLLQKLRQEARELVAIFSASVGTARRTQRGQPGRR